MKLLNKLNGWQRLWLLGTVAVQLFLVLNSRWRQWPQSRDCIEYKPLDVNPYRRVCAEYLPRESHLMNGIEDNLFGLFMCLAAYVAAHLAVIIVRWVISGFKKEN